MLKPFNMTLGIEAIGPVSFPSVFRQRRRWKGDFLLLFFALNVIILRCERKDEGGHHSSTGWIETSTTQVPER